MVEFKYQCKRCSKPLYENKFLCQVCAGWGGAKISPVGIMPRYIWVEHRVAELRATIARYFVAAEEPLPEWHEELEEHEAWLRSRKNNE